MDLLSTDKNVLITGGTGLIGTRLTKLLMEQGANVAYLSRSTDKGSVKSYFWNPALLISITAANLNPLYVNGDQFLPWC